jgi:hypothetical protein
MWLIVQGRGQGVAVERVHHQCRQDVDDEGEAQAEGRPCNRGPDDGSEDLAADAPAGYVSAANLAAAYSTGRHCTAADVSAANERCSFRRYGPMQ